LLPAISAVVCAAALLLSMATAKHVEPTPPPAVMQSFAQRWDSVPRVIPLPSRPVQTIAIEPDPPPPPARMDVLQTVGATASARRQAAVSRDICARHGLRKVQYGTKWRCRK
jgi:hypothetical protein